MSQKPYQIPSGFDAAPWRAVSHADLRPAAQVPTMLHLQEQRFYYWLARWAVGGPHDLIELGSFVGGATARLAQGLSDADQADSPAQANRARVHAFDRFTVDPRTKERHLYRNGIPAFEGRDLLPTAQRLLEPWRDRIVLHPGDIMQQGWSGAPISLLMLDACKTPELTDHIARVFYPHLIAGQSMIVQQDFLEWNQFWLPAHMLLMERYFTPVAAPGGGSVAFLCTRTPSAAEIDHLTVTGLSDRHLFGAIHRSIAAYRGWGIGPALHLMAEAIRLNPDQRVSWKMTSPRHALSV